MLRDILLERETNTLRNIVSHPSLQLALDRSHLHREFHRATNADFSRTIGSIWKASLLHPTQSFSVSWPMLLAGSPIKYFSYDVVVEASLFLISLLMPGNFLQRALLAMAWRRLHHFGFALLRGLPCSHQNGGHCGEQTYIVCNPLVEFLTWYD
jgi:hypothetical protein